MIIKLGIDICKALEVCQKHNIIHRDIKPENIFVSDMGDFKLGDFGIARQIEKTMSGLSRKGTFSYIAPEVYKGEPYGSTVDIYSLGMVMYRLLNNNRLPFMPPYPERITYEAKETSLLRRVNGEAIPMPSNDNGRLAEIVLKACAYEPKDRYDSPSVMRKALEDILYSDAEGKVIYPNGDVVDMNSVHYVSESKVKTKVEEAETVAMQADAEIDETMAMPAQAPMSEETYAYNQMVSKFYEEQDTVKPEVKAPERVEAVRENRVEVKAENTTKNNEKKTHSIAIFRWVVALIIIVPIACGVVWVGAKIYGKYIGESAVKNNLSSLESNDDSAAISDTRITSIAGGADHTIALRSDGVVEAVGSNRSVQCGVTYWNDITAVACGYYHTVGLKSDGTVVATGGNDKGQCDVEDWTDITAIACSEYNYTVGLKSDGTVVVTGNYFIDEISDWNDIVAIACNDYVIVGLKSDGTVVTTNSNYNVSLWKDIKSVSCGNGYAVGLETDGTVKVTGYNMSSRYDATYWTDIEAVACGYQHTVGLKTDGTVVAVGENNYGQCDVSDWTDIEAVACGYEHTIGLKTDGTVVATGYNNDGQCDVDAWNN
jgi:hypothetical protein